MDTVVEHIKQLAVAEKADELKREGARKARLNALKATVGMLIKLGYGLEETYKALQLSDYYKVYSFETIKTLYDEIISPSKQPDETT